jgi:uncharacterized protein (UPF0276 family)
MESTSWLGVGLVFSPALQEFVLEQGDAFDFLEIMPDTHWLETVEDGVTVHVDAPDSLAFLDALCSRGVAMVIHSIGLSIGSADPLDRRHLEHVAAWVQRYGCAWHSDHLASTRVVDGHGRRLDVGFPMAVPYDRDVLELLVDRVAEVQAAVPGPFLLENNVYYYTIPEQELGEAAFVDELCRRTGCGLLLDLHNLHVNARNHGAHPHEFLDAIDLGHVLEIHVAGGIEWEGVYLDAHSGACPPEVWSLLEHVVPRAPRLRGVTFEIFPSWYQGFGPERLRCELQRIREVVGPSGREVVRVAG